MSLELGALGMVYMWYGATGWFPQLDVVPPILNWALSRITLPLQSIFIYYPPYAQEHYRNVGRVRRR